MNDPEAKKESSDERYIPPPLSERRLAIMRFVFAALGVGAFYFTWSLTAQLAMAWRVAICVLVAAPFLFIPDLLRDKSAPPPGFVPRKWDDEEDD